MNLYTIHTANTLYIHTYVDMYSDREHEIWHFIRGLQTNDTI